MPLERLSNAPAAINLGYENPLVSESQNLTF